jgi:hypothetical protein
MASLEEIASRLEISGVLSEFGIACAPPQREVVV